MTSGNSSIGGGSSSNLNELQIMQILCTSQNNNMLEVSTLAQTQMSFEGIQEQAGQESQKDINGNIDKLKSAAKLSVILGVMSSLASALSSTGSAMNGLGASTESAISAAASTASGLGNGVLTIAQGGIEIAQGKSSEAIGNNQADSSVAGGLMKGFDQIAQDSSSTISSTIQDNAQITGKEQSIISQDRQSKLYH